MPYVNDKDPVGIGIIGIGVGAAGILPALSAAPGFELRAGADVDPLTRDRFSQIFPGARVYETADGLCADQDVEAVWIASPNRFHAQHAILAAGHGKHVIVEKPMALSIEEGESMVEASTRNGVHLLCGHTVSDPIPIRAMRSVIRSGRIGDVRSVQMFSYTDWLIRARTADELDPAEGGGLLFRQGPRQVDTVRMVINRRAISIRGVAERWMPERPIAGFYSAFIEFEGGIYCQLLHNGHGYLMTGEFIPWAEELERASLERRLESRRTLRNGTRDELTEKQEMRVGGSLRPQRFRNSLPNWIPGDPGILIVSCERGDMRHSRNGLYIYDDDGVHEVELDRGTATQRREELSELYRAIRHGQPLSHGGEWGLATLEICLGIMRSGLEHRQIELARQGGLVEDQVDEISFGYLEGSA